QVPFGATYVVALNSFTTTNLLEPPGSSFQISFQVPLNLYNSTEGTATLSGYIPGPDLPDLVWNQHSARIPKYVGGPLPPPVIPEPATIVLLGTGLFSLIRRRLSKKI
ncbi:MAG: PEP-CTERM sorting domain-containing protein, partial [Patescibacteria group bacterium]